MASSSVTERANALPSLNVVLCGSVGTLKASISDLIVNQNESRSETEDQEIRREYVRLEACGHLITLVDLPALFNPRLSEEEVMRQALRCVSLCHPGVHVFLFIIADGPLTDEDKAESEQIQRIFSSRINNHTMLLRIQKSEHSTEELNDALKSAIQRFGGRHEFLDLTTQVSMLMEKLVQTMEDNSRSYYSTDTFWDAQLEKLLKLGEMNKKHMQTQDVREGSDDVRIVLLGKTGVGKSAAANTILGREAFITDISHESVTKECQRERTEVNSRHITVIDTPGLFNTELSHEEIQTEMTNCISMTLPGPHVFIIVLSLAQRFTKEETESVKIIQETFGENSLMHNMVLFTRGDDLKNKTIEEYLKNTRTPLQNLIEQCGNRYHVFNNTETEDQTQVSALLEKIDAMVKENGGSYYSSKIFRQMERDKQEKQIKTLTDRIEQLSREKEEEIERMKMMRMKEKQNHEREKKKIEEEFREKEERYKGEMKQDEEQMELDDYENTKTEKEGKEREKDLQLKHKTEIERMRMMMEEEKQNHEQEKKKMEEQFSENEKQYREKIKEIEMTKTQEQEQLMRELEETQKRMHEDERKRAEDKQNWREKQEMLEKLIQNEQRQREEQCKNDEEKIQLIKQQHQDELMRVKPADYEDDRRRDIENIKLCCSQTTSCLQRDEAEPKNYENLKTLFTRLGLTNIYEDQIKTEDVLQISMFSLQAQEPQNETELVNSFLQKLLNTNYRARDNLIKHREEDSEIDSDIHPMDVQMAVFHCADSFLKQLMVTKLSQCQFALPLLVPDPFTQHIEFPLWTFRQVNKSWRIRNTDNKMTSQTQPVCKAETPMVSFFRFGSVCSSKSQLMNSLINEKHNTFFHRNCSGSSRSRLLMDGVVEIAWYCPSGKNTDKFTECVAFCNLHGDAGVSETQYEILTSMSSVNVLFLPDFGQKNQYKGLVRSLFRSPQPLICLLTENECQKTQLADGKFMIGLLNKNQSDLSKQIRETIRVSLTEHKRTFKLEDVSKHTGIEVDEKNPECQRGKEAALQIMRLLDNKDPSTVKETNLPCQGKLWHDWCEVNKELHHLRGENIEEEKSTKLKLMREIREKQTEQGSRQFMRTFFEEPRSLKTNETNFFLKWMIHLLDDFMSHKLCELHKEYDVKWNEVLALKKMPDELEQLQTEETNLEKISEQINRTAFGLEHIMREVGQIYESWSSVNKNTDFSSLTSLAAEMMMSGFPLELMDGDAAHVPLMWVSAVLDELIKNLGDQRVFVLSVLGIQSSGKSTLLNAMFGLEFAVSAGRCTRGAFMQLLKVSEDIKDQMKFDYILVVDTEGLRAPELDGRSTRYRDNELATFVVGLGNLTLINIFGENPSDMKDILQIVVQAFLRMKEVRLNPSCMFVHQNVSDVTAGDKNTEGRRRLLETLDEMTKLAAKVEVCDAECFSDVIAFDVQNDVKYFAQLWEGSPPMAPPNPNYCENVQELKESILRHVSNSDGMMLTHLRGRIEDLWKALLNEQFVFSFKNSLEIATYRKIETEYSKWSWSLRSAMLEIENKLHNRIDNQAVHEVEETDLKRQLQAKSEEVKKTMSEFFEKDRDAGIQNQWKASFEIKIKELQENIVRETRKKLNQVLQQRDLKKKIDAQRTQHENNLFEKSKELALTLKDKANDENIMKQEFECFWRDQVDVITKDTPSVKNTDVLKDVTDHFRNNYESLQEDMKICRELIDMFSLPSYSDYVQLKKSSGITGPIKNALKKGKEIFGHALSTEDEVQIRTLINEIAEQTQRMIQSFNIAKMGYNISYIQQLVDHIKTTLTDHEKQPKVKYVFRGEFFRDLVQSICQKANQTITDQHRMFRKAHDPVLYSEGKKEEYYRTFQKYCQGSTSAAITGEFICNKLKETIEQNVYKTTARDVSDEMKTNCESLNGNRSKLEKHILTELARTEDFNTYMIYIYNPREIFKRFIRAEVSRYITERFHDSVKPKMENNITQLQKKIINATRESTRHVQEINGDVHSWFDQFTHLLSDVLLFSVSDLSGVNIDDVDLTVLQDVMIKEIPSIMKNMRSRFTRETFPVKLDYPDRPDEILIGHFCQCCWVQCPFCAAICTNTIENHDGDHSVPFHRNIGLNGWYYRGTTNLSINICTSAVASDRSFYPDDSDDKCPWKEYRKGGPKYAQWSITPDLSELPYWKWFVCKFQKNLETFYEKSFKRGGRIPDEWRKYSKEEAIKSLDNYI
ncbi:interferon-induced very large GTPase 1-like isoform X2 [Triplophysa rosa]|nr:interferon-induced very large GTPase 1-like isoform X2 [Triplophysa rosa]